jgi:dolichyl-phosphate beta-glucosyltransferase
MNYGIFTAAGSALEQGNRSMLSSVIIIIPCYNEEKRLNLEEFKEFSRENHPQRFLFVNDGSTDGTLRLLENLGNYDPQRFAIHNLPQNVGKAEAVRKGLLRAFDARPDYIGYWDADLATPLRAILDFCALLDARPDLEMVFGARVRLLGRSIKRSAIRHYLGRVLATAISLVLGLGIYDTQCGAKLLRASPAIMELFRQPFLSKWLFDVEILARLIQARRGTSLRQAEEIVYELPLHEWHAVAGSKVRARDFVGAFFRLTVIYWKYLRPHRHD